jgi:hypothetical protein
MKHNLLILFAIAFTSFILLGSCTNKSQNFYRSITFVNYYQIVGRFPIADSDSGNVNCYHFIYDEKGRLVNVKYLKGGRLSNDSYFDAAQIAIEYSEGYEKRIFKDAKGIVSNNDNGVSSIRIKLNEKNYATSIFNYDKEGNPTTDNFGVYQYLWTLNDKGQRIKSIRINKSGERITDNNGFYELHFKYDSRGNLIEQSNHGRDGQLIENEENTAMQRMKYDDSGNQIEIQFYGIDEQLKENKSNNIAMIRFKYDNYGKITEIRYYGRDEQLKENSNSDNAIIKFKYDNQGNTVEVRSFGIDEQLKEYKSDGIAITQILYDKFGNTLETKFKGIDEQFKLNSDGYAMIRYKYDESGNQSEVSYYGLKDNSKEPILISTEKDGVKLPNPGLLISEKGVGPFILRERIPGNIDMFTMTKTKRTGEEGNIYPVYIFSENNIPVIEITPSYDSKTETYIDDIVGNITVVGGDYQTSDGIKVGSTYGEFKRLYPSFYLWYTYISDSYVLNNNELMTEQIQYFLDGKEYKYKVEFDSEMTKLKMDGFNDDAKIIEIRVF